MDKLKDLVASTLKAFPDLNIHITDVFCYGKDSNLFKIFLSGFHSIFAILAFL